MTNASATATARVISRRWTDDDNDDDKMSLYFSGEGN